MRLARHGEWLLLLAGFAWWLFHVWGYGHVVMEFEPRQRTLVLSWTVRHLLWELGLFVGPGLLARVDIRAWYSRRLERL